MPVVGVSTFIASARGRGLGSWLVSCALADPDLTNVYRWMLATRDAHEVYARLGFDPLQDVERWMAVERRRPSRGDL